MGKDTNRHNVACIFCVYLCMLNKNSLAVKSTRPIRNHNGYKRSKTLISSKAKKLNILLRIILLEYHTIVYRAFLQLRLALSLGHLIKDDGTKRLPSDKANHSCENGL